jgi:hypothetical protein
VSAVTEHRPNALLRGGPPHHGGAARTRHVADQGAVLKVLSGNRYDHFEPTSETALHDGRELRVFTWVRSTYVAE